jgi:CheY-like chemotaxis protein
MDSTQIDQIITNLAINSKESIQGIGKVSFETRNISIDAAFCKHHPELHPGDYVLLVVHDNGNGMDKTTLESVFEPFFSTKSKTSSTGLGLATVYGIVMQNNGAIIVSSEMGKGTTFEIYLPCYAGKLSPSPSVNAKVKISKGNETILFVEDDKLVRDITLEFLKSFGYTVLVAESPIEALSLFKEHSSTVHMLITDVIMPGMNGRDLALLLLKSRPALKILLISGYANDFLMNKGNQHVTLPFLGKPFTRTELALKVREILDSH